MLFIANHDEVFDVREAAVCTMGRLAEHNPAYVMPFLRKTLIEVLFIIFVESLTFLENFPASVTC